MTEPDPYTRETPLTDEQLANERKLIVKEHLEDFGKEIESFTCDNCDRSNICWLVFDPYNTDGDCLCDK